MSGSMAKMSGRKKSSGALAHLAAERKPSGRFAEALHPRDAHGRFARHPSSNADGGEYLFKRNTARSLAAPPTLDDTHTAISAAKDAVGDPNRLGFRLEQGRWIQDTIDSTQQIPGEETIAKVNAIRGVGKMVDAMVRQRAARLIAPDFDPDAVDARLAKLEKDGAALGDTFTRVSRYRRSKPAEVDAANEAFKEKLRELANLGEQRRTYAQMQAKTRVEVLGQLRPMGGTIAFDQRASSAGRAIAMAAAGRFPTDWHNHTNHLPPLDVILHSEFADRGEIPIAGPGRGYYTHAMNRLVTGPDEPDTTTHELTHRMEKVVPGLSAAQWAFWADRNTETDNGARQWKTSGRKQKLPDLRPTGGYGDDEITRPDEFADPYIGKFYGAGALYGGGWELAAVGSELLVPDVDRPGEEDDDYRQFILGLWAVL